MLFKIDENMPLEAVELLGQAGHLAHTVFDEQLAGRPDPNVAAACQVEQRVLITLDVLDLMHVLPRLWGTAHLFHKEASRAAEDFVRESLLQVLRGQTKTWIKSTRCRGTKAKLADKKLKKLRGYLEYLETNLHRMRYDEYLTARHRSEHRHGPHAAWALLARNWCNATKRSFEVTAG